MTQTRRIACAYLVTDAASAVARGRDIEIAGRHIGGVRAAQGPVDDVLVMPALTNAHDHGRAVRPTSVGGGALPLEAWLNYLAMLPAVDPYAAAVMSLGRSALGGVGLVMMHYTRAQGLTDLPAEVAEVARAARDVGVRVGFAVSMRDRNPLVYGPSEPILAALPVDARAEIERRFMTPARSPAEYVALLDAVADAAAGPMFDVQYGPNGVQWCSDALLAAIADASQRTGRRVHMHLLETRYQRAYADAAFPNGVVRHLDSLGLLSPRLTLAHCVWARADELELLAERGVTLAVNTSSNLHLRSGIAPLATMLDKGCRVALGLDATALDEDDDALRELRLAHLLHVGTGFKIAVPRARMLELAFANGRFAITNTDDGGRVAAGAPADLLVLDWAAIDDDRLRDDLDPLDLVFARATARHVKELIVAGRSVVRDGALCNVDMAAARHEVLAQMRHGMAANAALAAALPALTRVLAAHYEADAPCC